MALTEDDLRRIADVVQTRYQVRRPDGGGLVTDDAAIGDVWALLLDVRETQAEILALLKADHATG
jgi:hypothetical protein